MSDFNYQKAYCTQAVPAFQGLPEHVKKAHSMLCPLVKDLNQKRDLNIPLTDEIRAILDPLTTAELANLSRASYFVGHWHPSLLPRLFESKQGQSWKIANCCDQLLRERLNLPRNVQVHEGTLRVTFSGRDCWLWDEFALATEENLTRFKKCGLPFGETTLKESAEKLAEEIGDLWQDMPENDLYREYLQLAKEKQEADIRARFAEKIANLEKSKINAQKEIDFLMLCNSLDVPVDNVIYYGHTGKFCFGWRSPMNEADKKKIADKLKGHPYPIEFK